MKKLFITTLIFLVCSISILPYFIGRIQYTNVERTIQNFGNEDNDDFSSDGEIENVLRVYDFQIGVFGKPTFSDYYNSGIAAIMIEL